MIAERFWELLSKQAFAEATDAEKKELEQLIYGNQELKNIAESLHSLSHQTSLSDKGPEVEEAYKNHLIRLRERGIEFHESSRMLALETDRPKENKQRSAARKWSFLAVTFAFLFVGAILLRINLKSTRHSTNNPAPISQVTTKPASRTQIQLPDGSSVWLNASSKLTYDKDFGKEFREVNLTGEGFFDVAKDPTRPFIIHTHVIDVKVTGTEFNVRAYPNDDYTETSLIRGSVEITVKNRPEEKHFLKPNEKMIVANNILSQPVLKMTKSAPVIQTVSVNFDQKDNSVVETSWLNNRLVLQENETFREVALKMERWFGVHIQFGDSQVADEYRPFASFLQNETIAQALDELKEGYKFNYHISGDDVTITQ